MAIDIRESALIIVDVQNDFCPAYTGKDGKTQPTGALAVARGCDVVEPLNLAAEKFYFGQGKIVVSQDWHPAHHSSFASSHPGKKVNESILLPVPEPFRGEHERDAKNEYVPAAIQQILWPDHCVQGSQGAMLHPDLDLDHVDLIIRKGCRKDLDSYSVFFENDRYTPTGLDGFLKGLGITQVFIGGLATDYCVLYSVMDAIRLGYRTVILSDAVSGVGVPEGSVEQAFSLMKGAGVSFITTKEIPG
ncbi:pyrazinamidase/nicotinamidase (PZAase)(Nicotine deamidase) (NAMase) [Treponema primitia ZAS-2]|uniref:nicotinamidase n=1 Tax=Treponema primitia (strain ATCC BAA-887 / DSM 12427 / ZAS-2) TaxID=545694 RepID=F5YIY0_TREPZ|nr:nicotinamidase [Treponema primitia]AEF86296.1 pyrazinamidase/nicotinamidase (PZAase)(Nicotine deamidase) (NAMase) [Treponema primitia ZAS-2]